MRGLLIAVIVASAACLVGLGITILPTKEAAREKSEVLKTEGRWKRENDGNIRTAFDCRNVTYTNMGNAAKASSELVENEVVMWQGNNYIEWNKATVEVSSTIYEVWCQRVKVKLLPTENCYHRNSRRVNLKGEILFMDERYFLHDFASEVDCSPRDLHVRISQKILTHIHTGHVISDLTQATLSKPKRDFSSLFDDRSIYNLIWKSEICLCKNTGFLQGVPTQL